MAARAPAYALSGQIIPWGRELFGALALILAVKGAILAIDHVPRVFIGDSITYLRTAVYDFMPRDRSFTYGELIRLFAVPSHSLLALVLAQSVAGAFVATLAYAFARGALELPGIAAAAVGLLVAVEPAQLFYERMVMAEAFGGLAWFVFIACAVGYFRTGNWRWLPAIALAGLAAATLRMNGLAVLLGVGGLLPLWRWLLYRPARSAGAPQLAMHLALVLACTSSLHIGYRHLVGYLTGAPPGYTAEAGVTELGLVAPLVEPADFDGTGCPSEILRRTGVPLRDPTMREGQIWRADGLWPIMRRTCPDPERVAATVADRALSRHPLGLLSMSAAIIAQYFDPASTRWRMNSDLGRDELSKDFIGMLASQFGFDATRVPGLVTPVSHWFESAQWWITFAYLAMPFIAALALWRAYRRQSAASVLALIALLLSVSTLLFMHIISYRYLHPFPPLAILLTAWLVSGPATREA